MSSPDASSHVGSPPDESMKTPGGHFAGDGSAGRHAGAFGLHAASAPAMRVAKSALAIARVYRRRGMMARMIRSLVPAALALVLTTCAQDGMNLCPLQCFEDDCCDPVCKPAPKRGSACSDGATLCTYRSFDVWAAYECAGGEVQCYGTLAGCCPMNQPSGTCSDTQLRCRYDETLCLCDG